ALLPHERRAPGARLVAVAGALHLPHLRAQVAEQHGGVGPGEHAREIENEQAFERPERGGHRGARNPATASASATRVAETGRRAARRASRSIRSWMRSIVFQLLARCCR